MNFQAVTEFLDQVDAMYGVPACECMVFQDHRLLYHHSAGYLDYEKTVPLTGGQWYWIYSCTKLWTMTAVLQLQEQGKLTLDDPVERYLPVCADLTVREGCEIRPAKTILTIRHLMTMTGGFTYDQKLPALEQMRARTHNRASTRQMIDALCQEPLAFDPGTHYCYSMCHDVLAAVVEVVSGERFSDYICRHIAEPLGITGLTFRPNAAQLANMPGQLCYHDEKKTMFRCEKDNSHQLTTNYDSGGAGICCRVEDYILFADALACGGVGKNGQRILSRESIERMSTPQIQGVPLEDYHNNMKPATEGYGLGVRIHVTDDHTVPVGEFGWDGAAGATADIEPSRRLSIFYAQHVLNYLPNYAQLHPALLQRIYRAVDNNAE